jgi:hypothetical protein
MPVGERLIAHEGSSFIPAGKTGPSARLLIQEKYNYGEIVSRIKHVAKMKILIIGSGGREHAITWALRHTSVSDVEVYCAPGNGGIAQEARLVAISADDSPNLSLSFKRRISI